MQTANSFKFKKYNERKKSWNITFLSCGKMRFRIDHNFKIRLSSSSYHILFTFFLKLVPINRSVSNHDRCRKMQTANSFKFKKYNERKKSWNITFLSCGKMRFRIDHNFKIRLSSIYSLGAVGWVRPVDRGLGWVNSFYYKLLFCSGKLFVFMQNRFYAGQPSDVVYRRV